MPTTPTPPTLTDRSDGEIIAASHMDETHAAILHVYTDLAGVASDVADVAAAVPSIKGELNAIGELPATGNPGDIYLIDSRIYGWSVATEEWVDGGSIKGDPGADGAAGTIVGILDVGEEPPPGTAAGTLWWVADEAYTPPTPTYATPSWVGAACTSTGSITSHSVTLPAGRSTGDFAVVAVGYNPSNPPLSPTSGWSAHSTINYDSDFEVRIYTRTLAGGETVFEYSTATGTRNALACAVVRNVSGIGAITSATPGSPPTTQAAPSATYTTPFAVLSGWCERDSTPSTALTGPANLDGITSSFGTGTAAVSTSIGRKIAAQAAGSSFSPGDWVATHPDTINRLIVWSIALEIPEV